MVSEQRDMTVGELVERLLALPQHKAVRLPSGRHDRPDRVLVDARLVQRNGHGDQYVVLEGLTR